MPETPNDSPTVLSVTTTAMDGTEHTTRVYVYPLGGATPPTEPRGSTTRGDEEPPSRLVAAPAR